MPDIGTQLRDYLDITAPPVALEEIFARPVGDDPVRPLQPREPKRNVRGWGYAAAAAVVIGLLIGGVAWLTRSQNGVEPADEPVTTTVGVDETQPTVPVAVDSNRPTDPELGTAYDVVLDAFTAIAKADWQRFLDHLDPAGVVRDDASRPFATDIGISELFLPPSAGGEGDGLRLDYNGDDLVDRAELFVLQAHYLALAPIEVLGCEANGDITICRVKDTSVFHRAAGFEPDPIPVLVSDGKIAEIQIAPGFPWESLGGCAGCSIPIWDEMAYRYNLWLGLIPAESVCSRAGQPDNGSLGCGRPSVAAQESPLGIVEGGMVTRIWQFSIFPWINPDSFDEHRNLVARWLASRGAGSVTGPIDTMVTAINDGRLEDYLALLSDGAELLGSPFDPAVEEALVAAQVNWSIDQCSPVQGGEVTCVGNRSDEFHGAAGLSLDGVLTFRFDDANHISSISIDHGGGQLGLGQHVEFANDYVTWLTENHSDVAASFGPLLPNGMPGAADMPAALLYVEEFGAQLTARRVSTIEEMTAAYNAGQFEQWRTLMADDTDFREDNQLLFEAEASFIAANGNWAIDGDCVLSGSGGETRLTCPMVRSDDFWGAGGLDGRTDYVFTIDDTGRIVRYAVVGRPADENAEWFDDHWQFTDQFKEWFHETHPEVAAGLPREGEGPLWIDSEFMPIALEYVDQFVTQSTEWPINR